MISPKVIRSKGFFSILALLFRPLPTESEAVLVGGSEDDVMQYMDPEWSHLSLVYELLLHIVELDGE